MANSQQPTPQGNQYVVDFKQSINLDQVNENVYPFDDGVAPHLTNTGILRDNGVTNVYQTNIAASGQVFYTQGGHQVIVSGGDVSVDGFYLGTANIANVGRTSIDAIDFAISTTGTGIQLRVRKSGSTYDFFLEEINVSTGVVSVSTQIAASGTHQEACLIKSNSMTFANTRIAVIGINSPGNTICAIYDSVGNPVAFPYVGAGNMATFQGMTAISNGGRIIISGIPDNTSAPRTYYNTVSGAFGAWTAITDCTFIANSKTFETATTGTISIFGTPSSKSTTNVTSFYQDISITTGGVITITPSTVAGLTIVPSDLYSGFGFCSGRFKSTAATKLSPFYVANSAGVLSLIRTDYSVTDYAAPPQAPFAMGITSTISRGIVVNGILSQVGVGYSPMCEFGYISNRTAFSIYSVIHTGTINSYAFIPGVNDIQLVQISNDKTLWKIHEISKDVFSLADDVGLIYDASKLYAETNSALINQTFISDGMLSGTQSVAWQTQGIYSNSPDIGQINNVVGFTLTTPVLSASANSSMSTTFYSGVGTLYSVFKYDNTGASQVPLTAYVPNQNVAAPSDSKYNGGGITLKYGSALQTVNFATGVGFAQYYAGYTIANQYPTSYQFFNLFGQLYGFDGTKIYRMPINGATAGTPEQIAFASGLTLITNAPNVAWFWSSFDNSVYTFDGGQSLTKWQEMTGVATVSTGTYSVLEDSLYLYLSDDNILIFRGDKASLMRPYDIPSTIYATDSGTYLTNVLNNGIARKLSYYAGTGSPIQLTWQSGFYGFGRGQWARIASVVFTLKIADIATTDVIVNYKWLTSTDNGTETKTFVGGSYLASSTGYVRFQYIPTNPLVYGASVGISCAKKVTLYDCVVYYTDGGVAMVPNQGP